MKKKFILFLLLLSNSSFAQECLPARVEKDFPIQMAGAAFIRFSPDANFVIGYAKDPNIDQGATFLVDLRGDKPIVIKTVLGAEAYPVEGDWDLIGSSTPGGATYYELRELLKNKVFTKSAFRGSVSGLYHVSGSFPAGGADEKIVRTVSYDKLEFSDVRYKMENGKVAEFSQVKNPTKYLCSNLGKNGVGPEVMQVMLSKDGSELVGIPGSFEGNLKLFKINPDFSCTMEDIPITSQKPMFSHPLPGKKNYIAFHTNSETSSQPIPYGQVTIYDRDLKKYFRASLPEDRVISFSPGTLKDGRVAFIRETKDHRAKLVITDPYQQTPGIAGASCLKKPSSNGTATGNGTSDSGKR